MPQTSRGFCLNKAGADSRNSTFSEPLQCWQALDFAAPRIERTQVRFQPIDAAKRRDSTFVNPKLIETSQRGIVQSYHTLSVRKYPLVYWATLIGAASIQYIVLGT